MEENNFIKSIIADFEQRIPEKTMIATMQVVYKSGNSDNNKEIEFKT